MRNVGYALLPALVAACSIDAPFDGTSYRCDESQTCPAGFTCVAGSCRSDSDPDAGDADGDVEDGDVDAPDAWAPASVCGGLGILRDDFADGVGAWGQAFPTPADVDTSGELLRATVMPTSAADLWVGYRSTHAYALDGDAVEVQLGSLTGPGWAGVSVGLAGHAVELTLTETMARCDWRAAGTLTRIRGPRDGATLVRIGFRDGRAWCELADAPAYPDAVVSWRVIGSHPMPPHDLAQVSLIVGGSAGQSPTAATFVSVNAWRSDEVTAWCSPGTAHDQFDVDLASWIISSDDGCQPALTHGVVMIDDAASPCTLRYRQPLDLTSGKVGFELDLAPAGDVQLVIGDVADGSPRLVSTITPTQFTVERCQATCTQLAAPPRELVKSWLGYASEGGTVRVVTSDDAQAWTTLHTVAGPSDLRATLVSIGAKTGSARIKTFATQP